MCVANATIGRGLAICGAAPPPIPLPVVVGAGVAAGAVPLADWACGACTLLNAAAAVSCAVCDAHRPVSSSLRNGCDGGADDARASARAALDAALAALPDAPDLGAGIETVAAALARVRAAALASASSSPDNKELKAALVAAGRAAVARRGTDEWRLAAPAFGMLLQSLRGTV